MKTPTYKAQTITEDKSWPFVGNAYKNPGGSISLVLDRGVKLELKDGTKLEASAGKAVKIFLRVPYRGAAKAAPEQAASMPVTELAPAPNLSGVHLW